MCIDYPSRGALQNSYARPYIWLSPFRILFADQASWDTDNLGVLMDFVTFFPLGLILR